MRSTEPKPVVCAGRIKTAELLQDIRSGMDDSLLTEKYQISKRTLDLIVGKLKAAGKMGREELPREKTVPESQFLIRKRVTNETLFMGKADSLSASISAAAQSRTSLAEADLRGSNLARAQISGVDLSSSDLGQADLSRSELCGRTSLSQILSGENLQGNYLMGANLMGAGLIGAKLSRSNLARVDFTGADPSDADLSYCNWDGAKIQGVSAS